MPDYMTIPECERLHEERQKAEDERHKATSAQFSSLGESVKNIAGEMKTNRKVTIGAAISIVLTVFAALVGQNFRGGVTSGQEFSNLRVTVAGICERMAASEIHKVAEKVRVDNLEAFKAHMEEYLKKDQKPGAFGRFGQTELRISHKRTDGGLPKMDSGLSPRGD